MATNNDGRLPLGWSATERGDDVSTHFSRIRGITDIVTVLDSRGDAEELRSGSMCCLMTMLESELNAVESILENGAAQGGAT